MGDAHHHDRGSAGRSITSQRTQRMLVGAVAAVALAAIAGLMVLWPRDAPEGFADELGIGAELVDATVRQVEDLPCRETTEEMGLRCWKITFDVTSGTPEGERDSLQLPVSETTVDIDTGDRLVLEHQPQNEAGIRYFFYDFERRGPMLWLAGLFVLAVVALGRFQGLRALVGLVVTGVVIVGFLFPAILDGRDPTAAALVTAAVIGIVALYLTHGITERTTVALLGTFAALGLTAVLAAVFSSAAQFTGYATEDAFYLRIASADIDIAGLVLAGIIIGSLGVLDDVTVTQVSAVWQLHEANPTYGIRRLYQAGVVIGRDHIASTVNTLVLAYAGASLPLLLFFTQAGRSLGDVAVGELVAVEVVRTLVGSIGLVAAVPVTTGLAAWVVTHGSTLGAAGRSAEDGATAATEPGPPVRRATGEPVGAGDAERQSDARWERSAPRTATSGDGNADRGT